MRLVQETGGDPDPLRPFVTIAMPCFNEEAYIEACIASVQAQDYPRDRIEILVADGRSTDRTRAVLAALTERRVEVWVVTGVAPESGAALERAAPTGASPTTVEEMRERALARARTGSSGAVFDPGTGTASDAAPDELDLPLLVVNVDEARVDYPRLFRSGLFGGLHVERRAIASLSGELRRPGTRSVYWVGAADTSLADHVMRSEVALLEDANHPETKGTVPSQSWQKVIEPVLVVGLVVGLISLFYTNRP